MPVLSGTAPHPAASPRFDGVDAALVAAGVAALFLPTLWDLSMGTWAYSAQGHELLFAAVTALMLYGRRESLLAGQVKHRAGPALMLAAGLALYVVGRSQQMLRLEILALLVVSASVLLLLGGLTALRAAAFPLFFLLFIVPLPDGWVQTLTGPLKVMVSAVATKILFWAGLPVGRSGVVVTIGQYQLLVSEACAGLQTMFTLEAMGLLYAHLRRGGSAALNALLAAAVVPVAFAANVVRVMVLMLVTYVFGDAAGQGFVHGFSGLVLFGVALALIFSLDTLLQRVLGQRTVPR